MIMGQVPVSPQSAETQNTSTEIVIVPLKNVHPDASQTRKEFTPEAISALAMSIHKTGLLYPVLVSANSDGSFQIVDGERRYRAFKELQNQYPDGDWGRIPVKVISNSLELNGLIANLLRMEYNPIEFAEALDRYKQQTGLTNDKLGESLGKSKTNITEYLSLLKLPDMIKDKARIDSCVPFNVLKRLATQCKSLAESELIQAYDTFHSKFSNSATANENEAKNPAVKKDAGQNTNTKPNTSVRTATLITKKANTLKDYFRCIEDKHKLSIDDCDDEVKTNLKESLMAVMDEVKILLEKLDR